MRYILNSAVITSPGEYHYRLVSVDRARDWLNHGPAVSTIGYQETCNAMSALLGVPVEFRRIQIHMTPGDEALVFRLTVRLSDPSIKGKINDPAWIAGHCEIGILTMRDDGGW